MTDDAAAAPEENGEQSDETLGSRLRAARESRDMSIEKIADELRIEERVLHALEEDRLSDIKVAPVFVKGYIKQYGRLLDLDYEELREAFDRQADADDVRLRPNRAIYLRDERKVTIWVIAALAVLLVAVALLVWWLGPDDGWFFDSFGDAGDADSVSVAAPITSRTQRASEPAAIAAVPNVPAADESAQALPAQPDSTAPAAVREDAAAQAPGGEAEVPDGSENVPESDGFESVALADIESDPLPAVPEPGSIAMVFEFSDESWFELTDARGRRLHYDLAEPGSRLNFMALPPARVLLGNANVVSITVASEAFAVPNSGRRDNVAIFVIDPAQD